MNRRTLTIVGSILLTILYSMMFQWFFQLDSSKSQSVFLLTEKSYSLYWLQGGVFKEAASFISIQKTLNEHEIDTFDVEINDMTVLVISPSTDRLVVVSMMETCQSLGIDVIMKEAVLSIQQKQRFDQGETVSVLKEVMA